MKLCIRKNNIIAIVIGVRVFSIHSTAIVI